MTNICLVETNPSQYRIVGRRLDGFNYTSVGTYEEMIDLALVNGASCPLEVYGLDGYVRRIMREEADV